MNLSLPQPFIERIKKDLGLESDSFLGSFFDEPKRGLRINPLKAGPEIEEVISKGLRGIPWESHGYYYTAEGVSSVSGPADKGSSYLSESPGRSPLHAAGAYYIQEPSAMAPVPYLDIRPGMCVLDLCAAPGGKSTQIASYLGGRGLLVANEIIPDRARILSQNIERLGIRNALVLNHSPKELADRFPAAFDRILVDAPCSGEGMMRRDETAVREWTEESVAMSAKRQKEILDAAALMLKPGGRLVYSTCTFSKEEDEGQTERFLDDHPDFSFAEVYPAEGMRINPVKAAGIGPADGEKDTHARPEMRSGMMRIWPQDGFGEGHFVAVLERKGGLKPEDFGYIGAGEPPLNNKQKQEAKPYREFVADVIKEGAFMADISDDHRLFKFGNKICAAPDGGLPLLSGLKVIRAGLELGEIRKGRFHPSHSLALAMKAEDAKRTLELSVTSDTGDDIFAASDSVRARQYLGGLSLIEDEDFRIKKDPAAEDDGWTLITVSGISAGWDKASKGSLKNHYPKGIRNHYQ